MRNRPSLGRRIRRVACTLLVWALAHAAAQDAASASAPDTNHLYRIDLPTALQLAHARNLDVQLARQRLQEAAANRESAVEQFFPWIAPAAGFRRHTGRIQAVDGTMLDADKQSYAAGAAFTAQLELGDAIYRSLAAKQLVTVAGQALDSQQQDSAFLAAQAYFDLAKAAALVEVVREALKVSAEYQRQLHEGVGAGLVFKGDELRVQVQTEKYKIAVRQAVEQQRLAATRLAQVLHLDFRVELLPRDTDLVPLTLIEASVPLDSLVQQALRSRPELKQGQALYAAAQDARNGSKYGPLIPSIGAQALVGGLGGGKGDATGNFGDSEDYFVGLAWRIGPGGLLDFGRVHATEARLETVRLSNDKLRDEISRQVIDNHTRARSLLDQIAASQQNLTTASQTLNLTRERKEFGVGVVLEDIQAQQELTRARSDYLTTIAEFNKAQYGLARAVGDLSASGAARISSPPAPRK